jgi:drug/metabolite transporter (DMT)-like permease
MSPEISRSPSAKCWTNYKLGSLYALITAFLISVQEPFSFLAAKQLSVTQFVLLTQIALVISIPMLLIRPKTRRDVVLLLRDATNYPKLGVLFVIGMIGLLVFKLGLSNAHPIIISAIINLQPFFAALVALVIARVPIPVSPIVFFGCFVIAFIGAMIIAWSQVGDASRPGFHELIDSARHGSWLFAVPVPICSALEGHSSAHGSPNTMNRRRSRRISRSRR